jgi:trans-aconitate methyltransferase
MKALNRMFDDTRFLAHSDTAMPLVERLLALIGDRPDPQLLDLGCGSGALAITAALGRPQLTVVALDISAPNINAAQHAVARAGVGDQVTPVRADYMTWSSSAFDIIASDSVLNIIDSSDAALAEKLAGNLKPGGFLVASMPIDSAANYFRVVLRHIWRTTPKIADRLAFGVARRLYPNLPSDILLDRIPYLRILPVRLCGPALIAEFARHGLELYANDPMDSPGAAKLTHRLFVWRRH